jgi:hypothetical protein
VDAQNAPSGAASIVMGTGYHNVPNGGSRAAAVTSNRHPARLVFQTVNKPSADYFLLPLGLMQAAGERI